MEGKWFSREHPPQFIETETPNVATDILAEFHYRHDSNLSDYVATLGEEYGGHELVYVMADYAHITQYGLEGVTEDEADQRAQAFIDGSLVGVRVSCQEGRGDWADRLHDIALTFVSPYIAVELPDEAGSACIIDGARAGYQFASRYHDLLGELAEGYEDPMREANFMYGFGLIMNCWHHVKTSQQCEAYLRDLTIMEQMIGTQKRNWDEWLRTIS